MAAWESLFLLRCREASKVCGRVPVLPQATEDVVSEVADVS
jgi:hypothetical protein